MKLQLNFIQEIILKIRTVESVFISLNNIYIYITRKNEVKKLCQL